MDKTIADWEKNVRKVTPYVAGEQPKEEDIIKLNTNENPYPPSPKIVKALHTFDVDKLKLYPDPTSNILVQALAKRYQLDTNQIFVGVGSDDVLALSFLAFFNSQKPILFPDITYSFYHVWADLYKIPFKTMELDDEFHIVPEDYFIDNGGIIFPNPNAPTGVYLGLSEIRKILEQNLDVIVIIDEAYIDFGGESALSLIAEYENLLVVQTFSKSRSMAGMRIGYALGCSKLIQYLNDVKYSFNSYTMNQTSLILGAESVIDEVYFQKTLNQIINTREWTKMELAKLGFSFADSQGNFLFVTHSKYHAKDLFQMLRKNKIIVRYFAQNRIENFLRITIGTEQEMEHVIAILKKYINNK